MVRFVSLNATQHQIQLIVDQKRNPASHCSDRDIQGSRFHPVLNFQSRHSFELALVVGDEYPSLGFGMGGDP